MDRVSTERPQPRQVTLICNVLTEPAAEQRFVARVEVVATGEHVAVRDVEELLALVGRVALSASR